MKIGIVVPHIFMHRDILPEVIFSPAPLALGLAEGLQKLGETVTLFSPGPIDTAVKNSTADLHLFEQELAGRGDTYVDLLKKHPVTFVSLARQVQAELIAKAYGMANKGELDIVHIYTNEEDIALPFAQLCARPVIFTHHDPFNFLIKYKNIFPKYPYLNWLSVSLAQRHGMPEDTNWIGNIYHGLQESALAATYEPKGGYVAYLGRIIEAKGTHLAIQAIQRYNKTAKTPLKLKIAGKHYAGSKDSYWREYIEPELNDPNIEYVGFINTLRTKQDFLGNASALLMPSVFDEPFGMVLIESLACGTPVIGLDSGALPEVITHGKTGYIVSKQKNDTDTAGALAEAICKIPYLSRQLCRNEFEARFTMQRMCEEHRAVYQQLVQQ